MPLWSFEFAKAAFADISHHAASSSMARWRKAERPPSNSNSPLQLQLISPTPTQPSFGLGLFKRDEADAEVPELVVAFLPEGDQLVLAHSRLRFTGRQTRKSVALGEFPDVFRTDVDLVRPHERTIPDANHAEEVVVFQLPPIWLVKVAGAVEYAALAGVEFDIDFVPVKRPCRDNVMQCIHNVTL